MEEQPWRRLKNPCKAQQLLFFFVVFVSVSAAEHSNGSAAGRLERIAAGTAVGSVTGFAAAVAFLYAVRLAFLCAQHAPLRRGVVVFTPDLKTIRSTLAGDGAVGAADAALGGRYYKLALDSGATLAVKWLDGDAGDAPPARRHLEALSRVKHANVMALKAYAVDVGAQRRRRRRLGLVYDYIPSGTLEDAMNRVRAHHATLAWPARARIAAGVAKGLQHLHFDCNPKLLHCNLKPANVLLDGDALEPRLADSGIIPPGCHCRHFVAPECLPNCRYTEKADVYSFGMILAMLVTGKDPEDPFFAGRGGMARWLRQAAQHGAGIAAEAVDWEGMGVERGGEEEEQIVMAARVAALCLSELPGDRPSSDELVAMLTQINSL